MDPGIRQRLVGAFVLVGIVVVLVPAIMQGPGRGDDAPPATATRSVEILLDGPAGKDARDPLVPEPEIAPPPTKLSPAVTGGPARSMEPVATPVAAMQPATASPLPGADTAPSAAPGPVWAVQLGAFASREKAEQLVKELRKRGYAAFVFEYRADGQVLHRVRVGPEQDRDRAAAVAERLKKDGFNPIVKPHP